MKRRAKPVLRVLAAVLCIGCLSGCFDSRELDTIGIVMGTAIDKAEAPEKITITLQFASPNKGGSESGSKSGMPEKEDGGGSSEYINISESGTMINYMIREIQNKMSRMVYVAHSENIVLGEDLAKEGVKDCLDFFARAPEARMSQFLFVAEGKAADIYGVQPEFESMPASVLTKTLEDQKLTSQAPVVTLFDFFCCMIRKTKCPVLPIVRINDDGDKRRLDVDRCAVFKGDRLVGKFDEAQTRGLLFIENKIKSGVLTLHLEDAEVTAEIRKAKGSVRAHLYEDGSISYDVEVNATVGLGDQTGSFNVADPENMPEFLAAAEQAIKQEIQSVVDKSKKLNADVFGFGEYIGKKYPDEWKSLEDNWDALYPNVTVNIAVKAEGDGNGAISMPLTYSAAE